MSTVTKLTPTWLTMDFFRTDTILSVDTVVVRTDTVMSSCRHTTDMQAKYNIDRQTAARLLNVSLRTVDRYLATGKLSAVRTDGRVWLSNLDIRNMLKGIEADMTNSESLHDNTDNIVDMRTDSDRQNVIYSDVTERTSRQDHLRDDTRHDNSETEGLNRKAVFYKNLYEETKLELQEKQKMIDHATYRIGQLESQVASMVPLLEFQQQQKMLAEKTAHYEHELGVEKARRKELTTQLIAEIEDREAALKGKDKEVAVERLNKSVFAVILFVVLALQPVLWILLR